MKIFDAHAFTGNKAWDALEIDEIENATIRVHWTNAPPHWASGKGKGIFVVLDGTVEMKYDQDGVEQNVLLTPGMGFVVENEPYFVSHPNETARILVIKERTPETHPTPK